MPTMRSAVGDKPALAVDLGTGGGLAADDTMDGGRRTISVRKAQARNQALQPARRTMFSGALTVFGRRALALERRQAARPALAIA